MNEVKTKLPWDTLDESHRECKSWKNVPNVLTECGVDL